MDSFLIADTFLTDLAIDDAPVFATLSHTQQLTLVLATSLGIKPAKNRESQIQGLFLSLGRLTVDLTLIRKTLPAKPNVQKCDRCFAPTDPGKNFAMSLRAKWLRVFIGVVSLLGCARAARGFGKQRA